MAKSKSKVCLCASVALLFVLAIIILCVVVFSGRRCPDGLFKHAAVSADSGTCSRVGRDILQQGGSAVDGAIAALLCTSLVNPQSMGLGGGSIFVVRDKSGKVKVFNARETVPSMFKSDLLKDCLEDNWSKAGPQWIGVPGEIRNYEKIHQLYGRLPWASLFQPAIRLAREGFPLPQLLGRYLQMFEKMDKRSPLRKLFSHRNNTLLKAGDTVRFKKLADTLQVIADQGPDAFYSGTLANDLIQDVKDAGGSLSMDDLKSFRVKVHDAWSIDLGGYKMYVPPPPSGGAILSFLLNIMKGYSLNPSSILDDQKTQTYHRFVEAYKFANSRKQDIHDPSFVSDRNAFQLMSDELADCVRGMISDHHIHNNSYYNVTPSSEQMGTTHISVLDAEGIAVSVTSTINYIFGSKIYSPKTGIILNNQLLDFCTRADSISAGEKPPSSMAPAIIESTTRSKTIVIGASGGSMITSGMAQAIMNHLWFGKNLKEAISSPVVYVDAKNSLGFEQGFDEAVKRELAALGNTLKQPRYFFNVVNAISKDGNCIEAVSDARKLGEAAGY